MPNRTKGKAQDTIGMTKAPWIYVSDGSLDQTIVKGLLALIPDSTSCRIDCFRGPTAAVKHPVIIIEQASTVLELEKAKNAKAIRTAAITRGCNFASVNFTGIAAEIGKNDQWGTNHLDVAASTDAAEKVYKWLFTVLTVRETLHLIPEDQMLAIDKKSFPDYEYCPVSESGKRRKDAKIQFVALILEKPKISDNKKLTWSVADRSGVADFYFQFRDDHSQYTWDWVLNLKPGDRRALPRMPRVEVKEKRRVRVLKAPLRATGAIVVGTGFAIQAIGNGLMKVGNKVTMGPSSEWVPDADVDPNGQKIDRGKSQIEQKRSCGKKYIDVFNEKGERNWSDGASIASTDIGSDSDEKSGKEFV